MASMPKKWRLITWGRGGEELEAFGARNMFPCIHNSVRAFPFAYFIYWQKIPVHCMYNMYDTNEILIYGGLGNQLKISKHAMR